MELIEIKSQKISLEEAKLKLRAGYQKHKECKESKSLQVIEKNHKDIRRAPNNIKSRFTVKHVVTSICGVEIEKNIVIPKPPTSTKERLALQMKKIKKNNKPKASIFINKL